MQTATKETLLPNKQQLSVTYHIITQDVIIASRHEHLGALINKQYHYVYTERYC